MRMKERVRRDDRGAVLILVAVFAIVSVIFVAFVVDIGNQRQDRRQLTTATDASALDVATRWADAGLAQLSDFTLLSGNMYKGIYDCTTDAQDFLDRNRQVAAGDYECRAEIVSSRLATVRVFARGDTDYQIAPAIGIDRGGIGSSTAVRITAHPFGGLRPFALCASQPAFNAWYRSDDAQDPDTVTQVKIEADKFLPEACGKNNSDWGFVQFETQDGGTGNGNDNKLAGTIKIGSDDEITPYYDTATNAHRQRCLKDYDAQKSDHGAVTCIFDTNGAGGWNNNNTMKAFDHLIGPPGITFALPIYDYIVELRGGQTAFPVIGFAEARLVSYVQGGAKDNSVTLDLIRVWDAQPGFIGAGNRILDICDVGTTGGAKSASFDFACYPAAGGGGSTPPVNSSDPCVVNSVTPPTQSVPVIAGLSTDPVTLDVAVDNPTDCGGITATAVNGSTEIDLPQAGLAGSVYSFARPAGAPFGGEGLEYVVDISQGGSTRDDSARMTTSAGVVTEPDPECGVSDIEIDPRPSVSGSNLTGPFTVTAILENESFCGDLVIAVTKRNSQNNADESPVMTPSELTDTSATYDNSSGNWQKRHYRVDVFVDGIRLAWTMFQIL